MRLRLQGQLKHLTVFSKGEILSIIGLPKYIVPLSEFLRTKGLHPVHTPQAVADQDMLEFKNGESKSNLDMLLDGWKSQYIEEQANPWVLTDDNQNFLYGDSGHQIGPEKKRSQTFRTKEEAEQTRKSHGSIPYFIPKRWDDAPEKEPKAIPRDGV